jgi:hypothetical protein
MLIQAASTLGDWSLLCGVVSQQYRSDHLNQLHRSEILEINGPTSERLDAPIHLGTEAACFRLTRGHGHQSCASLFASLEDNIGDQWFVMLATGTASSPAAVPSFRIGRTIPSTWRRFKILCLNLADQL